MERKEKLYSIIANLNEDVQLMGYSLVDRMLYLEERLFELEKLPFIKIHPDDPTKQKELPARKMYIPLLQQYNLVLKTILKMVGVDASDDGMDEFKKYYSELAKKLSGDS
jgi:hypothetical protein